MHGEVQIYALYVRVLVRDHLISFKHAKPCARESTHTRTHSYSTSVMSMSDYSCMLAISNPDATAIPYEQKGASAQPDGMEGLQSIFTKVYAFVMKLLER